LSRVGVRRKYRWKNRLYVHSSSSPFGGNYLDKYLKEQIELKLRAEAPTAERSKK
jgi:hypothetical protein